MSRDTRRRGSRGSPAGTARAGVGDDPATDRETLGPAVEGAFLDLCDVVGRQVVAAPVALVDRRPELAGAGVNREADRVPEARREAQLARAIGVVARDRGAARIALRADVERRAHGDVETA